MMHTSAKAALGTYTNLAAECKVLPEDSEYIEKYITDRKYDIYKSTQILLPTPKFVAFYNGYNNIP